MFFSSQCFNLFSGHKILYFAFVGSIFSAQTHILLKILSKIYPNFSRKRIFLSPTKQFAQESLFQLSQHNVKPRKSILSRNTYTKTHSNVLFSLLTLNGAAAFASGALRRALKCADFRGDNKNEPVEVRHSTKLTILFNKLCKVLSGWAMLSSTLYFYPFLLLLLSIYTLQCSGLHTAYPLPLSLSRSTVCVVLSHSEREHLSQ